MSNVLLRLLITIALFGLATPVSAQECVNCWINPRTGRMESFDQGLNNPAPRATNSSTQRNVILYGRRTCGLTTQMMRQLDTTRIPYQFKNVDDRAVNAEMWNRLRAAGLDGRRSIRLPVVSVNGKTMVNASLQDVRAALR